MKTDSFPRRRFLQGGLAAATLFLPSPWAWVWAQSEGAVKLLRAPKLALVVGNAAYRSVPALRNPGNDARAIAAGAARERLRGDARAGRHARRDAGGDRRRTRRRSPRGRPWGSSISRVTACSCSGATTSCRWTRRSRARPTCPAQCVDISGLMGGVRSAANPMNVIILDACRDNPFAGDARAEQKGLSQMDAPPGTLLAYATAPGNTADDGDRGQRPLHREPAPRDAGARGQDRGRVQARAPRRAPRLRRPADPLGEHLARGGLLFRARRSSCASSRRRKRSASSRRSSRSSRRRGGEGPAPRSSNTCAAIRAGASRSWRSCGSTRCWPRRARSRSRSPPRRATRSRPARRGRTRSSRWATA